MAFIRYINNPNGKVYASLVEGEREGKSVKQKYLGSLGLVIDKEKGIFKTPKRGVYAYSVENGFSDLTAVIDGIAYSEKEILILDFGDVFILDEYLRTLSFYGVYCRVMHTGYRHAIFFALLQDTYGKESLLLCGHLVVRQLFEGAFPKCTAA